MERLGVENMDDNIIICENCYTENEGTKTYCKKCGSKLYNNNVENGISTDKEPEKEINRNNYEEENSFFESKNNVALIIKVLSILGGIIGFGYGCSLFDSSYTEELGIVYIIVSIVSAIFVYALGEIIQKLQNIEDNTRKVSN